MKNNERRKYELEDRLLDYAARIIQLIDVFPRTRAGNHVGDQLLRSGTAPLSSHGEAQAAESRDDFIHKLSIALKELKESRRWLRLAEKTRMAEDAEALKHLLSETEELVRIFGASLRTSRSRKTSK